MCLAAYRAANPMSEGKQILYNSMISCIDFMLLCKQYEGDGPIYHSHFLATTSRSGHHIHGYNPFGY